MTDSPLVTRQSRDKLARKPLSQLAAETPKVTRTKLAVSHSQETPNDSENGSSKRRSSRKNLQSPPTSDFCTSSPMFGSQENQHLSPPQESMIETRKSPRKKNNSKSSDDSKNKSKDETTEILDESTTPLLKTKVSRSRLTINKSQNSRTSSSIRHSITAEIEDKSSFLSLFYIGILAIVIGISVATYINTQNNESQAPVNAKSESFKRFARDLDRIRQDFPKQNVKTWASISGQFRRNMYGQATQPLCFLFVYNATVQETSTCLLKSIGSSIFYALNGGIVEGQLRRIQAQNSMTKGDLFDAVDGTLRNDKVVVIDDISQMNAEAVMALHGICDEGYMPSHDLKPVVLMTISGQQNDVKEAKSDFEMGAKLITNLWEQQLGTDKVHPLISRIASVVIKVLPDNKC